MNEQWPKLSFFHENLMIRGCVKSFKLFRCDMMTFWIKTVTAEKALESYINEILETVQKD